MISQFLAPSEESSQIVCAVKFQTVNGFNAPAQLVSMKTKQKHDSWHIEKMLYLF
jgi:hypothetical protein